MKVNQSIFLVIPTIRDLNFLEEWGDQFKDCNLIVIEDRQKKEVKIPKIACLSIEHYCWSDIKKDFGKDEWIFSRKNSGIRSYGFWKAYRKGADVIITLDDDCYPVEDNFVEKHIENLNFEAAVNWHATYPNPHYMYTRGFPYKVRNKAPVVVSHGLWSGALDMDAKTEIGFQKLLEESSYPPIRQVIPSGYYFPMSTMNLVFKKAVIPLMYFPLMGEDPSGNKWGYDRYDDIWAGVIVKKVLDHLGLRVVNGSPFVEHRKKSKIVDNLVKERRGLMENEIFWKRVDVVNLTKKTIKGCFIELTEKVRWTKTTYFSRLKLAMKIWSKLF